jgi:hypothetical protein
MLSQNEINSAIEVLKPYNPKRIGLFGSVARNKKTALSDSDILYSFKSPTPLFSSVDIQLN